MRGIPELYNFHDAFDELKRRTKKPPQRPNLSSKNTLKMESFQGTICKQAYILLRDFLQKRFSALISNF